MTDVPWTDDAKALEDLSKLAQADKWQNGQAIDALARLSAIVSAMQDHPTEPPVEPPVDPPVEPPTEPPVDPGPILPPVQPATGYVPGILPQGRQIQVAGQAALLTALGQAQPGDQLVLAAGQYADLDLARSGNSQAPICIVANDQVQFTGKIRLLADWGGVYGGKHTGKGVEITGPGSRVSRALMTGTATVAMTGGAHPRAMVDFVTFRNITRPAVYAVITDAKKIKGIRICFCHVDGHTVSGAEEAVMIVLTDAYDNAELTYEYNLFSGCMNNWQSVMQKELICCKTGGVTLRGNNVVNSKGGYISLRETRGTLIEKNICRDGSYIKVHGDDHIIRFNESDIEINAGTADFDAPLPPECKNFSKAGRTPIILKGSLCQPAHTCTRRTLVQSNAGKITVGAGYPEKSWKVDGLVLKDNVQAAARVPNSFVGVVESGVGGSPPQAVLLSPALVGWKGSGLP